MGKPAKEIYVPGKHFPVTDKQTKKNDRSVMYVLMQWATGVSHG